ncbi:MAG TPA: glycosyltransferase family 4 protein [Longimicrobium sp.]|nr:glycosyltransferase family 4 protein [Longimicrobium sp.]
MHLLFAANFAADTGYAWRTIQAVFRRTGERLVRDGHRVTVGYPSLAQGPPAALRGAPFSFARVDYPAALESAGGLAAFARELRRLRVDTLYLTDRPTWSWRYPLYRAAGVRRIIVHDRTSGERTRRGPAVSAAKRALHHVPGLSADVCIAVSEFVRRRLVEVNGVPPERAVRVYNGIDLARFSSPDRTLLRTALGVAESVRIVFSSGRAQPYKGVQTLIDAAALLRGQGVAGVAFAYAGDGEYLPALRARARAAGVADIFHFLGERADVHRLLPGADVAVVPSLWAEAFGLAVVEAMAAGVPVVATRTGGIPELVEDGRTGTLVPPGDPRALAGALAALLAGPALAREMAVRAAAAARRRFSLERCASELYGVISPPREAARPSSLEMEDRSREMGLDGRPEMASANVVWD